MFRRKKEPSEAQKAKDAREKKKLALFLTPNPPTPPLKKRTTRQPLKQGNAVLPRGVENDFAKDSESSSETSSASSDTSTSGSSSDKRSSSLVANPGLQPRSPRAGTAAQVQPQVPRKSGGVARTLESRPAGVSFKQDSEEIKSKRKHKEKNKAAALSGPRRSAAVITPAKAQRKSR
ncbi:uncharacterized protein [Dermacentor albipictus]|uniref:uncharacterized protein isoform X7 n=1 Tax=Dermacentor albipictus TaxID=60249 RepID=UPI0031FCC1D5